MCRPGSATGMTISVSHDSASLASTQSRRSRASAGHGPRVVGVELRDRLAEAVDHVAEDRLVEVDAAELLDALRVAEELEAVAVLRSTAASNVPPPRS